MLGVVCFSTILVAALIIFSSATWSNTVAAGPGTVTKGVTGDGVNLPDNPAVDTAYTFRLTVASNIDTTTGSVVIEISDVDIVSGNVTLIYDANNDGTYDDGALTPVEGADMLTFTIGGGALAWTATNSYDYDFQITYNEAGSYAVESFATA